jgi:hypothetical protein
VNSVFVEAIGWLSTGLFLLSIVIPQRKHLHALGIVTSITTGYYAFEHGATAIWVKWVIALFFHSYMWIRLARQSAPTVNQPKITEP